MTDTIQHTVYDFLLVFLAQLVLPAVHIGII